MISLGNVLRDLFFMLDRIIYGLVSKVYYLFYLLAETTIFDQDMINSFSSRIYILISVIMAFKLAFSFITYIVSPDSINDKQKGGGKLIKNIVVAIALLAAVPTIFNEAYYLQGIIMKNNVIPKLVLGGDTSSVTGENEKEKTANELATYTFLAFIGPSSSLTDCADSAGGNLSTPCVTTLNNNSSPKTLGTDYMAAINNGSLNFIFNSAAKNSTMTATGDFSTGFSEKEFYLLDYQWGISTLAGGYLCFVLLGFCFDLAVRIIKLGFLQLIAPIPILLSLSPDKKSESRLSTWASQCLSTWASLFIRIAVVTFALYFINLINKGGGIFSFIRGGQKSNNILVSVFVMFGILLFAKEFPKLLEDILGMKNSGKLTLNPFKKLKTDMVGAGLIGGATAGLLGGGLGGMARGAWSGKTAKDFSEGAKKAAEKNRTLREARSLTDDDGHRLTSFGGRMSARYNKATGANIGAAGNIEREKLRIESRIKDFDNNIKQFEEDKKAVEQTIQEPRRRIEDLKTASDSIKAFEDRAASQVEKGIGSAGARYLEMKAEAERLKLSGADASTIARAEGAAMDYKDNAGKYDYMNQALADPVFDRTATNFYATAVQQNQFAGINLANQDAAALHSTFGATKGQIGETERSIRDTEHRIRDIDDQIKQQQVAKLEFDQEKRRLAEREERLKANQDAIK